MRERVDFDVAQINGPSNIEDCTAIALLKSIIVARAAHVMAEAQARTAAAAELPRKQGDGTAAADAPEPPAVVEAADSKDEEIGTVPPRPEIGTVRGRCRAPFGSPDETASLCCTLFEPPARRRNDNS